MLIEAALSFLGLGVQPPDATWGNMLSKSREFITIAPHLMILPGLLITAVVLCLYIIGDGDAFSNRHRLTRRLRPPTYPYPDPFPSSLVGPPPISRSLRIATARTMKLNRLQRSNPSKTDKRWSTHTARLGRKTVDGKLRLVRRIGKVLRLQGESIALAVEPSARPDQRRIQKVAGVKLHARFGRPHLHDPPRYCGS